MNQQNIMSDLFDSKQNQSKNFLQRTAIVWKTAFGSIIAWEISRLTGSHHSYLAPLSFILCFQVTIDQSLRIALYRTVGTAVGVILIAFFAKDIPVAGWSLGIVLLLSTSLMKAFQLNDKVIHQVALSILFVLYFEHRSAGYAWDRIKDTLIGSIIAILLVMLILPRDSISDTKQDLEQFLVHLIQELDKTASCLLKRNLSWNPYKLCQGLTPLFNEMQQISQRVNQVIQSSKFNIYSTSSSTQHLKERFESLQKIFIHFAALTETLAYWSASDHMSQMHRMKWGDILYGMKSALRSETPIDTNNLSTDISHQMENTPEQHVFEEIVSFHFSQMIQTVNQNEYFHKFKL